MLLYIYLQYLFTKFSYNMKYIILMLFILNIYTCLCDNICKNNNFENIIKNLTNNEFKLDKELRLANKQVYTHVIGSNYRIFNRSECIYCAVNKNTCYMNYTGNYNDKVCYDVPYIQYKATEINIDELTYNDILNFCTSTNYSYHLHLIKNLLLDRNINYNNEDYINKIKKLYPKDLYIDNNKHFPITDENIQKLLCITTYISYTDRDVINKKLLEKDLANTGTEIYYKLQKDKSFRDLISNNLKKNNKLSYLNANNALGLLNSLGYIYIQSDIYNKLNEVVKLLNKTCLNLNVYNSDCLSYIYFTGSILYSIPQVLKRDKDINIINKLVPLIEPIILNYDKYLKGANLLNKTEEYSILKDNLNKEIPYIFDDGIKNIMCEYRKQYKQIFNKLDVTHPMKLMTFQCMIDAFPESELSNIRIDGMYVNDYLMHKMSPYKHNYKFSYKNIRINVNISSIYNNTEMKPFINILNKEIKNLLKLLNKNKLGFDIQICGIFMKGSKNRIKFGYRDALGIYLPSKNEFVVFDLVINNNIIDYQSLKTAIHEIAHNIHSESIYIFRLGPAIAEGLAYFSTDMVFHGPYSVYLHLEHVMNYKFREYDPVRQLTKMPTSPIEYNRDVNILSTIFIYFLHSCDINKYYKFISACEDNKVEQFLQEYYTNKIKNLYVNYINNLIFKYTENRKKIQNEIDIIYKTPLFKLNLKPSQINTC